MKREETAKFGEFGSSIHLSLIDINFLVGDGSPNYCLVTWYAEEKDCFQIKFFV